MSLIGRPVKVPTFSLKGISPLYTCTDTTVAAKIVYTLTCSRIYNQVTRTIDIEVELKVNEAIRSELIWT